MTFGGRETLTLSSGVTLSTGKYFVQLGATRLDLRYPDAGYGGSELVVSADERVVAMFVYSGQSEVGYELFRIDAAAQTIDHIGGLPYIAGESDVPVFSPDSRWLALVARSGPFERETGEWLEDVLDPDGDDEELEVELAQLLVQPIPAAGRPGEIRRTVITAPIPRNADFDAIMTWHSYGAVSFSAPGKLVLAPKWAASISLDLPVGDSLRLTPFEAAYEGVDE